MTEKFVIRLMDDQDRLLAWAEIRGESKPQGERRSCPFWPTGPTVFPIEQAGTASKVVVHWCELDLARVQAIVPMDVQAGQSATFNWIEPVWLVAAMDKEIVLPPVTVRQTVTLAPPTGNLAAVAQ